MLFHSNFINNVLRDLKYTNIKYQRCILPNTKLNFEKNFQNFWNFLVFSNVIKTTWKMFKNDFFKVPTG